MATVISPSKLTRLQYETFVSSAELQNTGRSTVLAHAREHLARQLLNEIVAKSITTEGGYMGYQGNRLSVDVYVLSPKELHNLILEARQQGERDALQFPV